MLAVTELGLYVVAVVFVTKAGGDEVPKYTSCEVAPVPPVQLSVGVTDTPTLPFEGDGLDGVPGAEAATSRVAGKVSGLFPAPVAVIVIVPLYVPDPRPAGSTDAEIIAGVEPEAGFTDSQPPLEAFTAKARGAPLLKIGSAIGLGAEDPMA